MIHEIGFLCKFLEFVNSSNAINHQQYWAAVLIIVFCLAKMSWCPFMQVQPLIASKVVICFRILVLMQVHVLYITQFMTQII